MNLNNQNIPAFCNSVPVRNGRNKIILQWEKRAFRNFIYSLFSYPSSVYHPMPGQEAGEACRKPTPDTTKPIPSNADPPQPLSRQRRDSALWCTRGLVSVFVTLIS